MVIYKEISNLDNCLSTIQYMIKQRNDNYENELINMLRYSKTRNKLKTKTRQRQKKLLHHFMCYRRRHIQYNVTSFKAITSGQLRHF